ncbi:Ribosomal RNA small subunit methyltransferase E [compost metagenome]
MTNAKPLRRIYFPDGIPEHGRCLLPRGQAHHVVQVLRLRSGDAIVVFDGHGNEYEGVIDRIDKSGVGLTLGARQTVDRESPLAVTLAQGISSGERMDYTIQKAVELGIGAIQPLETSRGVVRLDGMRAQKRLAHWRAIVIAACEQCGRNRVPEVAPVMALRDWLGQPAHPPGPGLRVILAPQARIALRELARPPDGVALLCGPEGGFTTEERQDAERAGFIPARLGPRVLRTETAAVAALAAMQTLWGDF